MITENAGPMNHAGATGRDLTFSAPMSVSVAFLIGRDPRISTAFAIAVRSALDHLQMAKNRMRG